MAVAALLEELAGQAEVGLVAGLAVQLGQRGLDDGVAVVALVAQEVIDQVVGEPGGHGEQRVGGGLEVRRGAEVPAASSTTAVRCAAIAAWIRWPAQYSSWLEASWA